MQLLPTRLDGPLLIQPAVFGDERGFFQESYRDTALAELGITERWVQDNHSRSVRGVLRGMHFQLGEGQAKLVRCARGSVMDAVVDIRPGSSTFGQWEAHILDDERHLQLLVPVGFAHGFCVLSEFADVLYKCSNYYDPEQERTIAYDDPDVAIAWPRLDLIVSERDRNAPRLREMQAQLPANWAG